ncbi:MAG: histidine--tRNA ligase [Anaerolineaceae bacterium]|nr:histidine--tRNA ligase [Anaerolineaceae bacterium]
MKTTIQPVKGMRDFYPEQMAFRNWLYGAIRKVSESFGYQEYEGPILEKIDLYAAKSGEELVKEQAFVFPDRGGDLITLRPELTPTLARLVAQRQNELAIPLRWWSFGPFFRYERPQKGRAREFFQWNIDLIGAGSTGADAELIAVCAVFLQKIGLTHEQVGVFVNDRRLMDSQLAAIGIQREMKQTAFRLIDRRDKMPAAEWEEYALASGLNGEQLGLLKEMLGDRALWQKSEHLVQIFAILEAIGVREYVSFDPQVIRGLDYYTGTVFEARDRAKEGRAILGGGRYDNLVEDVGGAPLPSTGFAMGDMMIAVILEKYGVLPDLVSLPAEVMVSVFDEESMVDAFALSTLVRSEGISVLCYPEAAKLSKQLKYADRIGIRLVLICGPDEKTAGMVTVKNLTNGTQQTFTRGSLGAALRKMLA